MRRSSMFVGALVSVFAGVAGCSSSDDDGVGGEGTGKTGLEQPQPALGFSGCVNLFA